MNPTAAQTARILTGTAAGTGIMWAWSETFVHLGWVGPGAAIAAGVMGALYCVGVTALFAAIPFE